MLKSTNGNSDTKRIHQEIFPCQSQSIPFCLTYLQEEAIDREAASRRRELIMMESANSCDCNLLFMKAHISSNQGVIRNFLLLCFMYFNQRLRPHGLLEEEHFLTRKIEHVLKKVKGILDKLTPETFDLLEGQLMDSVIITADILKGAISLIHDKVVLEPAYCPMFALLCSDLHEKLPPFHEPGGGKEITCKRVLLKICQDTFEGAAKLREELSHMTSPDQKSDRRDKEWLLKIRKLGNIRLIGELFKHGMIIEKTVHHIAQELLGPDTKSCPAEENVEAICQFFITIGKKLDENQKSRRINDIYFNRLKELSGNQMLVLRSRFMIRDVMDLRSSNWIPRRQVVIL